MRFSIASYPVDLTSDHRFEHAFLRAESAYHGSHGHAGLRGDRRKRDLVEQRLREQLLGGIDDPLGGLGSGIGSSCHVADPLGPSGSSHIHVSEANIKIASAHHTSSWLIETRCAFVAASGVTSTMCGSSRPRDRSVSNGHRLQGGGEALPVPCTQPVPILGLLIASSSRCSALHGEVLRRTSGVVWTPALCRTSDILSG